LKRRKSQRLPFNALNKALMPRGRLDAAQHAELAAEVFWSGLLPAPRPEHDLNPPESP